MVIVLVFWGNPTWVVCRVLFVTLFGSELPSRSTGGKSIPLTCVSQDLKRWGAWDTTCGHKTKNIRPSIVWRREAWKEKALEDLLWKDERGPSSTGRISDFFFFFFLRQSGVTSERRSGTHMGFSERRDTILKRTELNLDQWHSNKVEVSSLCVGVGAKLSWVLFTLLSMRPEKPICASPPCLSFPSVSPFASVIEHKEDAAARCKDRNLSLSTWNH